MTHCTARVSLGIALLALMAPLSLLFADEPARPLLLTRVVDAPFEEVVLHLTAAITGANFRVTGENDIGGGVRERGDADFPRYRVIHFCNLELAREGVLIDRRLGAIMPCRVAVYQDQGRVVLVMQSAEALLAPLANPALAEFERKLDAAFRQILDDAAN